MKEINNKTPNDGNKLPPTRKQRRETNRLASVQASLTNVFFEFCKKNKDKDQQLLELDRLDRQWKTFVQRHNKNPKNCLIANKESFLKFINDYLSTNEELQTIIKFMDDEKE